MSLNASYLDCGFGEPMTDKIAVKIAAYVFIMLAAVLGNLLVCLVVYKNKEMQSTINYIIVNIAASDILIPVFAISRQVLELSTGSFDWRVQGSFGNFLCKFVFFVSDLSPIVSIASLVFLTTERFAAVYFPFKVSQVPPKVLKFGIALTWFIAVGYCLPHFYTFRLSESGCCIMSWEPAFHNGTARDVYISMQLILFIFIPFTFMAVMYPLILYKLRTKSKYLKDVRNRGKKTDRVHRNVTLLSFCIVLSFGLCWGPYLTTLTIVTFVWDWDFANAPSYWETLWFTAQYLSYANTVVNPLLCLIFVKAFRDGAKNLFIGRKRMAAKSTRLQPTYKMSSGPTFNDESFDLKRLNIKDVCSTTV